MCTQKIGKSKAPWCKIFIEGHRCDLFALSVSVDDWPSSSKDGSDLLLHLSSSTICFTSPGQQINGPQYVNGMAGQPSGQAQQIQWSILFKREFSNQDRYSDGGLGMDLANHDHDFSYHLRLWEPVNNLKALAPVNTWILTAYHKWKSVPLWHQRTMATLINMYAVVYNRKTWSHFVILGNSHANKYMTPEGTSVKPWHLHGIVSLRNKRDWLSKYDVL